MNKQRYPIGIQTFSKLREEGFLYIDKTELVYNLTHLNTSYVFLSRPRRFGKSLLTSTLRSYFEGRKDLFEGLAIADLETEWRKHPVLHFSMAGGKHMDEDALNSYLDVRLSQWEKVYKITPTDHKPNDRLAILIQTAYEQTGEKVVVLIDEYDAPLLDVVGDEDGSKLKALRNIMRNFYSPLKDADPYLRFVFLTGITKFSQLSIFSELNNIKNVSMLDDFAAICGITKEEMLESMGEGIDRLSEELELSREETIKQLTDKYDGYHFTKKSPDIFNPYSLLNCFSDRMLEDYWFGSGTPTFLIEMLRKFGMTPTMLASEMRAAATEFDTPTETLTSITPLLYQSGYITIKGYDNISKLYTLGIPNGEVRVGLMQSLVPNYLHTLSAPTIVAEMYGYMARGNINAAFEVLQKFFRTVPYCNDIDHEGHWQQMLYVVFSIFGAKGDVEIHTADGRLDLVMLLYGTRYLVEIKLDGTAAEALQQINDRRYADRFALEEAPLVKIGVNFSTTERTVTEWVIEQ